MARESYLRIVLWLVLALLPPLVVLGHDSRIVA